MSRVRWRIRRGQLRRQWHFSRRRRQVRHVRPHARDRSHPWGRHGARSQRRGDEGAGGRGRRGGDRLSRRDARLGWRPIPEDRRDHSRRRPRHAPVQGRHLPRRHRPPPGRPRDPREGPAPRPAVQARPVHQPPAGEAAARRGNAARRPRPQGHRLRRRPREHRGSVLRRRRLPQEGHARRGRGAAGGLHAQGDRALHPLGLRVHPPAEQPQEDVDTRGQDERADVRPRPVVADVSGRRPRVSRRQDRLQPRRRLLHVDDAPRIQAWKTLLQDLARQGGSGEPNAPHAAMLIAALFTRDTLPSGASRAAT